MRGQSVSAKRHLIPLLNSLLIGTLTPPRLLFRFRQSFRQSDKVASCACSNRPVGAARYWSETPHSNLRKSATSAVKTPRGFAPSRGLSLLPSTKATKLPTKLATKWRHWPIPTAYCQLPTATAAAPQGRRLLAHFLSAGSRPRPAHFWHFFFTIRLRVRNRSSFSGKQPMPPQ